MLDEDEVAFLKAFAVRELAAGLGDDADILVTHDDGVAGRWMLVEFTSVPQMPPTSIFISAASAAMSGMGYSRISVLLGPVRTAASTCSATKIAPYCFLGLWI